MGKISNYARVIKAKLQDVFVIDSTDSNVTTTKSVTVEQIGDAICGEQVHADLETDDQTIIGGINENKDKVGDLTALTTLDKSSVVGAVNEIDNDIGTINTYITEQGNIQKATLPSGKLTIDDIQSWCNTASKGFYWGVCYITSSFSAGWAIVQIANKIVSPSNAEILLTMSDYIITSFTRNMTDWTTKSGTLS